MDKGFTLYASSYICDYEGMYLFTLIIPNGDNAVCHQEANTNSKFILANRERVTFLYEEKQEATQGLKILP